MPPEQCEKNMSAASEVIRLIERVAGRATSDTLGKCRVGGAEPELMVAPESEDQLVEIVRVCSGGQVVLAPVGAALQEFDIRPRGDTRPVVLVSTQNLQKVHHYSSEDLTLTIGAGLTLGTLDDLVRPNGQHLPFDPPFRRAATLGGAIACNAIGPRSLLHGPIGHSITGASMVLPDGTLIKSGARTVKNVAGYDLQKMFIGSYGSLGIVTRVSLRLKALPEDFRLVRLQVDSLTDARSMIDRLASGPTRPCMIEILNSDAAARLDSDIEAGRTLVLVGYEGAADEVAWQLDQIDAAWKQCCVRFDRDDSRKQYEALASWPEREADFAFEAIAPAPHRWALIESCSERGIAIMAHSRNGPVLGCGTGDLTLETAAALRADAGPAGSVKFTRLPAGSNVPRWSCSGSACKWMRTVKEKFDRNRVFPWPGFLGS